MSDTYFRIQFSGGHDHRNTVEEAEEFARQMSTDHPNSFVVVTNAETWKFVSCWLNGQQTE